MLKMVISAILTTHLFENLSHVKVAKIKKKPWHPYGKKVH